MKPLGLLATLLLLLFLCPSVAANEISFRLHSTSPILSATSTLFTSAGQDLNTGNGVKSINRISKTEWEITVSTPSTSETSNAKIAVIAVAENGEIITSPAKWLSPETRKVVPKKSNCARRDDLAEIEKLYKLDADALKTLAEVRSTKARVLELKLRKLITPEVAARVFELEKSYGLANKPISADTTLKEIVARLSKLNSLISPIP